MRKCKVRCYNCSKEGFNTEFIQVKSVTNTNAYFCSEECKEYVLNNKQLEFDCFYLIIDLMGEHVPKSSSGYLKNQLKLKSDEDLELIKEFLLKNNEKLTVLLSEKEFINKTVKLKYVLSVVTNAVKRNKKWKEIQEKRWKEEEKKLVNYNQESCTKTVVGNNHDISEFLGDD